MTDYKNTIIKDPNFIKISIEDADHLHSSIKYFGQSIVTKDSDGLMQYGSKFIMKDKKNIVFKSLNIGFHTIKFQNINIYIDIINIGIPVGLAETSQIHNEMCVYIHKNNKDKLDLFLDESSKYYVAQILELKKNVIKLLYIFGMTIGKH